MKKTFLATILDVYKATVSFGLETLFGKGCRFSPTCSEYAVQAIEKNGVTKGSVLALKRLARCHPFASPRFDPA